MSLMPPALDEAITRTGLFGIVLRRRQATPRRAASARAQGQRRMMLPPVVLFSCVAGNNAAARGAASQLRTPASSWPGLSRPSTPLLLRNEARRGCPAQGGHDGMGDAGTQMTGTQNESRKRRHRHHARRREDLALRLSPRRARPVPDAVRGVALPVRDGRGAGLSAVSVARDRPGRMVHRAGLRLCARRRARRRPVRGRVQLHGAGRAAGLSRADRLDRQAAVVQRPDRRHRAIVLRDGAVADGDLRAAGARLHRAV